MPPTASATSGAGVGAGMDGDGTRAAMAITGLMLMAIIGRIGTTAITAGMATVGGATADGAAGSPDRPLQSEDEQAELGHARARLLLGACSGEVDTGLPIKNPAPRMTPSLRPVGPALLPAMGECQPAGKGAREELEPPLLRLVEAAIERLGGISQTFETGGALGHGVGAAAQPFDRIGRPRLVAPRIGALEARLGEIADRLLDRRPVLLLVGGELEPSPEGGDARVGEGAHVLGGRAPLRGRRARLLLLLGSRERGAGNRQRGRCGEQDFPHGILQ